MKQNLLSKTAVLLSLTLSLSAQASLHNDPTEDYNENSFKRKRIEERTEENDLPVKKTRLSQENQILDLALDEFNHHLSFPTDVFNHIWDFMEPETLLGTNFLLNKAVASELEKYFARQYQSRTTWTTSNPAFPFPLRFQLTRKPVSPYLFSARSTLLLNFLMDKERQKSKLEWLKLRKIQLPHLGIKTAFINLRKKALVERSLPETNSLTPPPLSENFVLRSLDDYSYDFIAKVILGNIDCVQYLSKEAEERLLAKKYKEAFYYSNFLISRNKSATTARIIELKATLLYSLQEYQKALKHLDCVIETSDHNPPAESLSMKASCLIALNQYNECLYFLEKTIEKSTVQANHALLSELLIFKSKCLFQLENYDKSLEACDLAINKCGNNVPNSYKLQREDILKELDQ